MSYLVLARKYRPTTFEEVVGQPAIARTLKNAIEMDRVAHAYLFAGPRGVGKTSSARILARALCCEKGPTPDPCGSCSRCVDILKGADLDVVEIDAASNRGIDDIRALRDKARVSPMRGRVKFYIIDEVHQLTSEAFNALLKILEEPPAHVLFVLATTEPEKIPDTIRSRCQFFEFGRVPDAAIAGRLEDICAREGIPFEKDALAVIARAARGGMRDSQSLLDQVITHGRGEVTLDGALAVTGSLSSESVRGLVTAIVRGELARILAELGQLIERGIAPESVLDALIAEFREIMVLVATGDAKLDPAAPAWRSELGEAVEADQAIAIVNLLIAARRRIREHDDPQLPLEVLLVRLGRIPDTLPIGEAIATLRETTPSAPAGRSAAAASRAQGGGSPSAGRPSGRSPQPGAKAARPSGTTGPNDAAATWDAILNEARRRSPALAAFLGRYKPISLEGNVLSVEGDSGASGVYNMADTQVQRRLREVAEAAAGRPLEIRAVTRKDAAPASGAKEARSRSVIDRAKEMFDGQVIE